MGNKADNKFTWVISEFSSLTTNRTYSDQFIIGGCNWHLYVVVKKNITGDDLSLFLEVPDSGSLLPGWERYAKVSFTIVNQRFENLSRKREFKGRYSQKTSPAWGFNTMITLNEVNAKDSGFLVNGAIKIVVEIDVLEIIGKIYIKGFHLFPSQVDFVSRMFKKHPEMASEFRLKNHNLRTGYISLLLSLVDTLCQSPREIPNDDFDEAYATLSTLTSAGFKLDWLETRLDQLSETKEKEKANETRMQEIENELNELKQKCTDLETQLVKEKTEVLAAKTCLSFDDLI